MMNLKRLTLSRKLEGVDNMILIDFSQVIFSEALDFYSKSNEQIEMPLLRHLALSKIMDLKNKFKKYSDEIVICLDGQNYWRKQIFPYYKQQRKLQQEKTKFDWDSFFENFNQLKQEFKDNLPFKIIEVESAEADDIIAVLCFNFAKTKDIIIVSSDKDLLQLQAVYNLPIKQYSPYHEKFIDAKSQNYDLFVHIVKGDSSDGIPNILSDDDVFLQKDKRQKPISTKKLDEWRHFGDGTGLFCESVEQLEKFNRNQKLIDMRFIPKEIEENIIDAYNNVQVNSNLFDYMVKHRLRKLLEKG